jgi:hypothetical protein
MTAAPQEVTATLVDQFGESGRTVGAVGLALSRGLILVEKAIARFALHGVVPVIFAAIRTGPTVNVAPAEG